MAKDQYKEKFRPDETALDREVEAALGGMSIDDLYDQDSTAPTQPAEKGMRRGRIVSVDKDDVFVDFGGKSQGIVPMEQFEHEPVVGQEMEFKVDRYDPAEGLLILSVKGVTASDVTWENLEIGQVVEGAVTGTNKGGLELDIKGMRAFMPAGQVDVYHVPDLAMFVGQRVKAEVTQFQRESRNLILSRRNILEREREEASQKLWAELAEGQIRRGTVRKLMDFGAFVDLGGADGLLHVSEMSYQRGRKPSEFVKEGDVVDVKVIKIDREAHKLSLSLKQARGTDPWAEATTRYAVGTVVTGRVTKTENFGAFIEVEEGIEGLLPISEISFSRIRHPSDVLKEGDTVKLMVISIDPAARRLAFSLKQAGPDPWATVQERYAQDMVVTGQVTRVVDFGAFVELEPGLEGLVHISELANQPVRSASSLVKVGQELRVCVLEIDKDARRISLSLKRVAEIELPASAPAPTPSTKKKRPQLRGGLDH